MDHKEELAMLVKIVKAKAKENGEKMGNEEISERLGFQTRVYLSQLIHGHKPTNEGHIRLFRDKFKDYLPQPDLLTRADIKGLESSISVLIKEIAKLKADIYKKDGKDAKDYLEKLKIEISLDEADRLAESKNQN